MSVKERWEGYRGKVYGGIGLSAVQERECAQAFYAGMFAGFVDLLEISNGSSEDEAVGKVEAFREDCFWRRCAIWQAKRSDAWQYFIFFYLQIANVKIRRSETVQAPAVAGCIAAASLI